MNAIYAFIAVVLLGTGSIFVVSKKDVQLEHPVPHFVEYGWPSKTHSKFGYYYYKVDSFTYEAKGYYDASFVSDEKFYAEYELGKPSKIVIDPAKPMFIPGETTAMVEGTIISIHSFHKHYVLFSYSFNNHEYRRTQVIPKKFKEKYPDLKAGLNYQVELLTEDPRRAVINLDKPMNGLSF